MGNKLRAVAVLGGLAAATLGLTWVVQGNDFFHRDHVRLPRLTFEQSPEDLFKALPEYLIKLLHLPHPGETGSNEARR